jgi:hypothetical protein
MISRQYSSQEALRNHMDMLVSCGPSSVALADQASIRKVLIELFRTSAFGLCLQSCGSSCLGVSSTAASRNFPVRKNYYCLSVCYILNIIYFTL